MLGDVDKAGGQPTLLWFTISLRQDREPCRELGMLEFASMEAAREDARAAIPDMVADLLRAGEIPSRYSFYILGADDQRASELPFAAVLRP